MSPKQAQASGANENLGNYVDLGKLPAASAALPATSPSGLDQAPTSYIVRMVNAPALTYDGGVPGHAATRPAAGQKIDSKVAGVEAYRGHLRRTHDAALASVGGSAKKLHSYSLAFNGFAAKLTPAQASKLALNPGVLSVGKTERLTLNTSTTPTFLGLPGKTGVWDELDATGEGIIIGVLDSGIAQEHPSFSDRKPGKSGREAEYAYEPIKGWAGICESGPDFPVGSCNRKLIGARSFSASIGIWAPDSDQRFAWESNSPRDRAGHGTHTASTAAGNKRVAVTGPSAGMGTISGMAHRARVAVYKVCWNVGDGAAICDSGDVVAAIDQAVADGVDVINYSISGSRNNMVTPVGMAFEAAAASGVFVAVAGGNSGRDGFGTVQHPSPWVTTVAATTHNRRLEGSLQLADGTVVPGQSKAAALANLEVIDAASAALPGVDPAAAALCLSYTDLRNDVGVLDPAKVAGKVVLCDRGSNARVNKSLAVMQAGGKGMVLMNVDANNLVADDHWVPTLHVDVAYRDLLKNYAGATFFVDDGSTGTMVEKGPLLSFLATRTMLDAPAPTVADFSSRGPSLALRGQLLKPDLGAPGVNVFAAIPSSSGRDSIWHLQKDAGSTFGAMDGTSMATPHVAGIAALIRQVRPRWSPMAIKSAMMTSAIDTLVSPDPAVRANAATDARHLFTQGAGFINPAAALDPGLVFDSAEPEWLSFLCGANQIRPEVCTQLGLKPIGADELNVPSIAIPMMVGSHTVSRRVTNVGKGTATYRFAVTGLSGLTVRFSPSTLTVQSGQSATFKMTVTRTTAALNTYVGGFVTLTGGTSRKEGQPYRVRVPVVVNPMPLQVAAEVTGSFPVKFGYDGPFGTQTIGLVPSVSMANKIPNSVTTSSLFPGNNPQYTCLDVPMPANTRLAHFALSSKDVSPASADLDLYWIHPVFGVRAVSENFNSDESITLAVPPNTGLDSLVVCVAQWKVGAPPVNFVLETYMSPFELGNNYSATPSTTRAKIAASGMVTVAGTPALVKGKRHMGVIQFTGEAASTQPTVVTFTP